MTKQNNMTPKQIAKAKTADEARELAIEWQHWQAEQSMSYGELAEWQKVFTELADRFPELVDEFKENSII